MAGSASGIGTDSDSSQKTTTTNTTSTLQQDRRQVVDNGGVALSTDNSTITYNTTDHGAVAASAEIARLAIQKASDNAAMITKTGYDLSLSFQNTTSDLIARSFAQQQSALQAVSGVVSKPLDNNDPTRTLLFVGVIVVGIVAFIALKGK